MTSVIQAKTGKPQGRGKILWLIPIILAVTLVGGYLVLSGAGTSQTVPSTASSQTTTATTSQNQPTSAQTATAENTKVAGTATNEKSITVRVTKDGFDGKPDWRVTVKKGDNVKITFVYADENGDEHQLFISGYDVYTARFSPQDKEVSMQFKATETGTFALFCLNPNCKAHNFLIGKIVVTS